MGRVSVTAQSSSPTGEFTLERDPINVGNVARASVRARAGSYTREPTQEKSPMSAVSVGGDSTTVHILVHIRELVWERDSKRRNSVVTASSVRTRRNMSPMGSVLPVAHTTTATGAERGHRSQPNRPFPVSLTNCPLGLGVTSQGFLTQAVRTGPVSPSQCIFTVICALISTGW